MDEVVVPEVEIPWQVLADNYERELGVARGEAVRQATRAQAEYDARVELHRQLLKMGERVAELEAQVAAAQADEGPDKQP